MSTHTVRTLINKAVERYGSQAELGRASGYSQHAIWKALKSGQVSAEMAVAIDRATEGDIPRAALRPDIFHDCSKQKERT